MTAPTSRAWNSMSTEASPNIDGWKGRRRRPNRYVRFPSIADVHNRTTSAITAAHGDHAASAGGVQPDMLYGRAMSLTDCNRRAFMGVAAGTALAGTAILTS